MEDIMGNRLNLGAGYGITLSRAEIDKLDPDAIGARIDAYVGNWIDRSWQWISGKIHARDDEQVDEVSKLSWYGQFIDTARSKKDGKLVIKGGSAACVASDMFLYPSEHGSKTFFGYISKSHYNDDVCCAVLYPLEKLGVAIEYGDPFEYLIPVSGKKPMSIENRMDGENKHPSFVPNPDVASTDILFRYAELLKQSANKGVPLPFQTRDECDEFTGVALKQSGIISVDYQLGLELVQVFYPGKALRDIERYIVGWWS
jgi:hypothetical protein